MGIINRERALYMATGIDNTGLYSGRREAMGIIKAMASQITSFDVFSGIGLSAATAFASAAKDSYNFEKEFRKNMLEVATISTQIGGSMTDFMNRVVSITQQIPVSAPEAAKALYQIVSAGHDGADGMKVLEVSARSAVGGLTDTATAADAITTLLNAYKLSAEKAEQISDQLFTTVRLGKTDFGQLGRSIAQVAPIAAAYGVEIDQVLAAVATLTKQGTPTAQAMTQIRAAIVGVSKYLGDGAYNSRTFQEALEMVRQKAGGSEAKLREFVPEIEAVNGLLGLTGQNAREAASHLNEMGNSTGATEAAFKKMKDEVGNQMTLLASNIHAALRPMGTAILEEVSSVAKSFNKAFADGSAQEALKHLGDLIVIVGGAFIGYKGAVLAASIAQRLNVAVLRQAVLERKMEQVALLNGVVGHKALTTAQLKQVAMRKLLTSTIKVQTAALAKNTAALLSSPYTWAAVAISALGLALYKYATQTTAAETAQDRLNKITKKASDSIANEQAELKLLLGIAKNELVSKNERLKAIKKLNEISPQYLGNLSLENINTDAATKSVEAYTKALLQNARTKAAQEMIVSKLERQNEIDLELKEIEKKGLYGLSGALLRWGSPEISTSLDQAAVWRSEKLQAEKDRLQKEIDDVLSFAQKDFEQTPIKIPVNIQLESEQANISALIRKKEEIENRINGNKEQGLFVNAFDEVQLQEVNKLLQESLSKAEALQKTSDKKKEEDSTVLQRKLTLTRELSEAETNLKKLRAPESKAGQTEIDAAQKKVDETKAKLKALTGTSAKEGTDLLKSRLEAEKKIGKELRDFQLQNRQAEINFMKEGAEKKLAQMELDYDKEIAAIKDKEKEVIGLSGKSKAGERMMKLFGDGNVDVLARPLIDAAELVKKGWEDAGEGIATVFSSQYGIQDANGKQTEILVTPILPDGTVLSPTELESYIDTTLNGAEDILEADSKGIVIKTNVSEDGKSGDELHKLQEEYYNLDDAIMKYIASLYESAKANKDNSHTQFLREQLEAERQSLTDYLEEYGTFQQQKLAITQEYAEKIKNAQNKWEEKSFVAERDAKLSALETEAIKANIDWVAVFGEFGGMFNDMIKPALEEAKKYIQTDKFKSSDQASQKALIDAINQMEKSLGGAGSLNFKKLGQDVKAYQRSMLDLENAKAEEIEAIEKLKKAQEKYEKALKNGTEEEKIAAKTALDTVQVNADAASTAVKAQTNVTNQNQQAVSDTATRLKASMEDVTEGLSRLAGGGIKNAYDGLIQASRGVGGAFSKLADGLKSVPIVGWILSIIDVLKDGLSNLVGSLLDSILNAVSGIISDVLTGNLLKTIFTSLVKGVGNILNALTFGIFSAKGNAKEVNEIVDRLTNSNKYLTIAIEKLTDELAKSGGEEATKKYEEARKKQEEKTENDRQMLEAKMGYNKSHHSNDYYINKAFNAEDWKKASDYVGKTMRSASDLWKLTPEELAKLKELPDIWEKIHSGKYDQSEWLDEYIGDAETLIELQQQWQDAITDTSFDNIKGEMKDLLGDFKAESKDAIASVNDFMKQAILNSITAGTYADEIEEWQEMFAAAMSDGVLTDKEAENLRNRYKGIWDEAVKDRDAAFAAAGIEDEETSSRQATEKGIASMSQDSANELIGIWNASLIYSNKTAEGVTSLKESMNYILEIQRAGWGDVRAIKELTSQMRVHTEKISELSEMIESNTKKAATEFETLNRQGLKIKR